MFKKLIYLSLLFPFFLLHSCQKVEILEETVFNYNQLPKIIIKAETKIIEDLYESKFSEPYIDHSLNKTPKDFLKIFLNTNINIIGTENFIVINILDASLKKTEILDEKAKKYEEKSFFLFELNFLVQYILFDDSDFILAKTIVEANRTTTTGKHISINESNLIIDNLILESLRDFSSKSDELMHIYMRNFIL